MFCLFKCLNLIDVLSNQEQEGDVFFNKDPPLFLFCGNVVGVFFFNKFVAFINFVLVFLCLLFIYYYFQIMYTMQSPATLGKKVF